MHSYLFLRARRMSVLAVLFGAIGAVPAARAAAPNVIGLTVLRATTTNLNGAGIRVAMAEWGAESATNWQVNPAYVGRPTSLFAYYSALGSSTSFPNAVGAVSAHANSVGWEFFSSSGVATNTAHMDIYEEHYFSNSSIAASTPAW
jgi:hypothetical protein